MSLTLRFEKHGGGHQVYSCERYNVSHEHCQALVESGGVGINEVEVNGQKVYFTHKTEAGPLRHVIRMFRSMNDDNPYYESVGEHEPHGVCFVMNESGKTIDTIR